MLSCSQCFLSLSNPMTNKITTTSPLHNFHVCEAKTMIRFYFLHIPSHEGDEITPSVQKKKKKTEHQTYISPVPKNSTKYFLGSGDRSQSSGLPICAYKTNIFFKIESTWNIKNHIDGQANGMNQRNVQKQRKKPGKKTLNPKTSPVIKYNHEINKTSIQKP